MRILHTSVKETGQIYLPFVNWGLYVCIVLAVVMFGSSDRLAAAYGIAVTTNMMITTVLTFFVLRFGWHHQLAGAAVATVFFFAVDATFLAANAVKVLDGGWFPLVIGAVMFLLLITPNALLHNLKHNKVLHETNIFVTVRHHEVPWIGFDRRCEIEALGHNCWQVMLNFGFKNEPDVPEALKLVESRNVPLDEMDTSYFLSRDIVIPTLGDGMAMWREKLFAGMHRNAAAAADFLSLPTNRVVELGAKVEI